ncbi:cupin domain-containing protein [Corynebacterium hylobatis]|uniref:Cupin domain-containing protein n=1 Tax=Corynebacterium hylobatis TaxID=1859290 RepID=A0A430HZ37_9CORY|nr:cupin domain-containing protein [Corynebacterium hylobatis]RSZ64200.1 cupin domain-containing protein [Corynebacterium hylobatis]
MRKTTSLKDGTVLSTKRMEGVDGAGFPPHTASHESALVILEGTCTITFGEVSHELHAGDTFIIPADEVHQVVGLPDFTAIHVMPRDIRFNFKV